MSDWGEPRLYIRVDEHYGVRRATCGNCGCPVGIQARECRIPAFIDGCPGDGCGVRFQEITSPFEEHREFCETARPDLEYVVKRWG